MKNHALQKIGIATLLLTLALLSVASVGTLNAEAATAIEDVDEGSYGWVYVANGVYHCDDGGAGGCSPQSAHSWTTVE